MTYIKCPDCNGKGEHNNFICYTCIGDGVIKISNKQIMKNLLNNYFFLGAIAFVCFGIMYIDVNVIHKSTWDNFQMGTIGWISLAIFLLAFGRIFYTQWIRGLFRNKTKK
jgi:hypothetical protein